MTFSDIAKKLNIEHTYSRRIGFDDSYKVKPLNRDVGKVVKSCLEAANTIQ